MPQHAQRTAPRMNGHQPRAAFPALQIHAGHYSTAMTAAELTMHHTARGSTSAVCRVQQSEPRRESHTAAQQQRAPGVKRTPAPPDSDVFLELRCAASSASGSLWIASTTRRAILSACLSRARHVCINRFLLSPDVQASQAWNCSQQLQSKLHGPACYTLLCSVR